MALAVPVPYTWSVGDTGNAAILNAQIRDPALFFLNPPVAEYVQTSVQALGNAATTTLTWPTPATDSYSGYSSSTPTRYTPTVAGWYLVSGNIGFANTSVTGMRMAQVAKNGATAINQQALAAATTGYNSAIGVLSLVYLNGTGDYIELQANQSSGVALNSVVTLTTLTVLFVHA